MIVVDTSVWIDYFRGLVTPQTDRLDTLLGVKQLLIGDLILAEVSQGFVSDRDQYRLSMIVGTGMPGVVGASARLIMCQEFHARHEGDGRRRQPFDRRMKVVMIRSGN